MIGTGNHPLSARREARREAAVVVAVAVDTMAGVSNVGTEHRWHYPYRYPLRMAKPLISFQAVESELDTVK